MTNLLLKSFTMLKLQKSIECSHVQYSANLPQDLIIHNEKFQPVLKELVKENIDLLLANPARPIERLKFIQAQAEKVSSTDQKFGNLFKEYHDTLCSITTRPISQSVRHDFQANKKNELFQQIDKVTPNDIKTLENVEHFPSALNALKPIFQKLSAYGFDIVYQMASQFEQLALMLFEPILLTTVGITAFCALTLTLHFKQGSFLKLITCLRDQTRSSIYRMNPIAYAILKNSWVKSSQTLAAIFITVLAGGMYFIPLGSERHSLVKIVESVPTSKEVPEPLKTGVIVIKNTLEIIGAETFKISSAFIKGAVRALFDDNRETLKAIAGWFDEKGQNNRS